MRSALLMPAACTATTNSVSPGTGSGCSWYRRSPSMMVTARTRPQPTGVRPPRLPGFSTSRLFRLPAASHLPALGHAQQVPEHDAAHQAGEDDPDEAGLVRDEPEVHRDELRVLDDEGEDEDDQGQDQQAPDGPAAAAAEDVVHLSVF